MYGCKLCEIQIDLILWAQTFTRNILPHPGYVNSFLRWWCAAFPSFAQKGNLDLRRLRLCIGSLLGHKIFASVLQCTFNLMRSAREQRSWQFCGAFFSLCLASKQRRHPESFRLSLHNNAARAPSLHSPTSVVHLEFILPVASLCKRTA